MLSSSATPLLQMIKGSQLVSGPSPSSLTQHSRPPWSGLTPLLLPCFLSFITHSCLQKSPFQHIPVGPWLTCALTGSSHFLLMFLFSVLLLCPTHMPVTSLKYPPPSLSVPLAPPFHFVLSVGVLSSFSGSLWAPHGTLSEAYPSLPPLPTCQHKTSCIWRNHY